MENIKKTVSFLDANGCRARIDVEVTHRNGYPELSMTGKYMGAGGQVIDEIKPANKEQRALIRLWRNYHLKNIGDMPDFKEKLEQLLERIENGERQREEVAEKKTGDDAILKTMEEEGIDENMLEAVKAYLSLGIGDDLSDFTESYCGEYFSDEEFAREQAEEMGLIDNSATWPHNCIDWKRAAREMMMDYSESDGFYFRIV